MEFNLKALSTAALLCVVTLACEQGGLAPNPDAAMPGGDVIKPVVDTRTRSSEAKTGPGPAAANQASTGVSGTVSLAAGAKAPAGATLFVISRKAGVTAGPPLAVARLAVDKFPASFELTQQNVMIPGQKLEGSISLSARLDGDGNAMTKDPGDLEAALPGAVTVGTSGISLVLGGDDSKVSSAKPAAAPKVEAGTSKTVSGSIALASGAVPVPGAVLYVMAKRPGGGGPPIAVLRAEPKSWPFKFELSAKNAMMASIPFEGPFEVSARLDEDGDAMSKTAGDLLGVVAGQVDVGASGLELTLKGR